MISILIEQGANIYAQGCYCYNALLAALLRGYGKLVPMPLEKGTYSQSLDGLEVGD